MRSTSAPDAASVQEAPPSQRRPRRMRAAVILLAGAFALMPGVPAVAQVESVSPGINRYYENPNLEQSSSMFEREGREVFDERHQIVAAVGLKPGMAVADIGAGTGLFTRLFAAAVGPTGRVYAVDISPAFVQNIARFARDEHLGQVESILGGDRDSRLSPASVDVAFVCDTYHHFEYPRSMLASIRRALRPGGVLVVVDYERIPGASTSWILKHVRAGKETVIREIEAAGFRLIEDRRGLLKENYLLRFRRLDG